MDIVVLFGFGYGVVYIGVDFWEMFEIGVDECLCFGLWNV